MTQHLIVHPENPQIRLIQKAVEIIQEGGVIVYPTDSAYALGCRLEEKNASERIRRIRQLDKHHHFTLMCHDLSQLATYARVDNSAFRLLKAYTPGSYTFILPASKEVPRRLVQPKRKTIGLRVPSHPIPLALLACLGEPMMSVTLILPGMDSPLVDLDEIQEQLEGQVDLIIDGGPCMVEPTTVVDLTSGVPQVLRYGKGDASHFSRM